MNDTVVTVVGNVVDAPRLYRPEGGGAVTNFRVASTARRYDTRAQEFVDAGTFWVDVECWNELSGNVSGSISKGDPVIVHGTLTTHSWDTDSGRRSTPRIRASAVGPNLARGRADFRRARPVRPAEAVPGRGEVRPADDAVPGGAVLPGPEELLRGRDYTTEDEALHPGTTDDLPAEPAHV